MPKHSLTRAHSIGCVLIGFIFKPGASRVIQLVYRKLQNGEDMKNTKNSHNWRANGVRGALTALDDLQFCLEQMHPDDVREIERQSALPTDALFERMARLISALRITERALRAAAAKPEHRAALRRAQVTAGAVLRCTMPFVFLALDYFNVLDLGIV